MAAADAVEDTQAFSDETSDSEEESENIFEKENNRYPNISRRHASDAINMQVKENAQLPPLLGHLKQNDIQGARRLLENGYNATEVDKYGNNAIHYAVGVCNIPNKEIKSLLEDLCAAGVNVNARNHKGETPLHLLGGGPVGRWYIGLVYRRLSIEIYGAMKSLGADVLSRDNNGQTPLFHYVRHVYHFYPEVFEAAIQAGESLTALDYKGNSLLFYCASGEEPGRINWLLRKGLDAAHTDYDGNTIFHYYVKSGKLPERSIDILVKAGMNPTQPNNSQRSPLHSICAIDCQERGKWTTTDQRQSSLFEIVRQYFKTEDMDVQDSLGIAPLHLAATFDAYLVRRLLELGANPAISTNENMTALHLASRARQPNVVGIMLEYMKNVLDKQSLLQIINRKDEAGKTALSYACASGVVETVKLLIHAGVKVNCKMAFNGCLSFEDEALNWPLNDELGEYDAIMKPEGWRHGAGSVLLGDTHRTCRGEKHGYSIARLDDVLLLLQEYKPKSHLIDSAIVYAAKRGHSYTVDQLLQMRNTLWGAAEKDYGFQTKHCIIRQQSFWNSVSSETISSSPRDDRPAMFNHLMLQREYRAIEKLSVEDLCVRENGSTLTVIHKLCLQGFANTLYNVLTPSVLDTLAHVLRDGRFPLSPTLLMAACRCEMPNMDVIKLLVEKHHVDVNEQNSLANSAGYPRFRGAYCETALHILSRDVQWWQKALAVPYLVSHGADLEARDDLGCTPLHAALMKFNENPTRSSRVFETLIELGANVDALVDGKSCISIIGNHPDVVDLLLRHSTVGL